MNGGSIHSRPMKFIASASSMRRVTGIATSKQKIAGLCLPSHGTSSYLDQIQSANLSYPVLHFWWEKNLLLENWYSETTLLDPEESYGSSERSLMAHCTRMISGIPAIKKASHRGRNCGCSMQHLLHRQLLPRYHRFSMSRLLPQRPRLLQSTAKTSQQAGSSINVGWLLSISQKIPSGNLT
jgi:hypothetical protein